MMLRTTVLTFFLAASRTAVSECTDDVDATPPDSCFDYNDLTFDLPAGKCRSNILRDRLKKAFKAKPGNCKGGFQREYRALMGTVTVEGADQEVHDQCAHAMAEAAGNIDKTDFDIPGVDLGDYFDGHGFLNEETGNFQQSERDFNKKGGYDTFLHISTDPTKNDHYTTTDESYAAGLAIKELFDEQLKTKYLNAPSGFAPTCQSNTAMCCWHRDRQYFDDNGSCGFKDCANENPGDNTDLCWTEHDGNIYPYPGDGTENDLHCHGLSWGNDYDLNNKGKWNALFYVSMYDHLYQRGYVESITNDSKIAGKQPMCGCIEDMNPVARADCQEVTAQVEYTVTVVQNKVVISPKQETFQLNFNACEGLEYVEDLTPASYALEKKSENYKTSNNDLAGFVFKQWLEGQITDDHVQHVEDKLVGFRDPSVNNNDNKRQQACEAAFNDRFPNLTYEEIELTEVDA